jgi:hypothetical protein
MTPVSYPNKNPPIAATPVSHCIFRSTASDRTRRIPSRTAQFIAAAGLPALSTDERAVPPAADVEDDGAAPSSAFAPTFAVQDEAPRAVDDS